MVAFYYVNVVKLELCFPGCLSLSTWFGLATSEIVASYGGRSEAAAMNVGVRLGTTAAHAHCWGFAGSLCWPGKVVAEFPLSPFEQQLSPLYLQQGRDFLLQLVCILDQVYELLQECTRLSAGQSLTSLRRWWEPDKRSSTYLALIS